MQGNTQNHLTDIRVPLRFDMVSGLGFFFSALEKNLKQKFTDNTGVPHTISLPPQR